MTPTWFEIECVDGVAATLYLNDELHSGELGAIRAATDALPQSVRILRVQVRGGAGAEHRTAALRSLLRSWSESRRGAVHMVVRDVSAWPRYPSGYGEMRRASAARPV